MIHITLPDNSVKEFEKGTTPYQIAQSISEGLARNVLAAKVNDKVVAIIHRIEEGKLTASFDNLKLFH